MVHAFAASEILLLLLSAFLPVVSQAHFDEMWDPLKIAALKCVQDHIKKALIELRKRRAS